MFTGIRCASNHYCINNNFRVAQHNNYVPTYLSEDMFSVFRISPVISGRIDFGIPCIKNLNYT